MHASLNPDPVEPCGRLAVLLAAVVSASAVAAPYDQNPPTVRLGAGATIAAWPPPHELKDDPRILDTLTKEIYLQEGAEFGVVGPGNQPLRPVPSSDWWTDLIMNGDGGLHWQYPLTPRISNNFIEVRRVGGLREGSNGGGRDTVAPLRIGGWNGEARSNNPRNAPLVALDKARASAWSDWMVSFRKSATGDASKHLDVTMVRCMPYIWFEATGFDPVLSFDNAEVAFLDERGEEIAEAEPGTRETLVLRVDGKLYGLHVAAGTSFQRIDSGLVAKLPASQRHLVVSALPDLRHLATFAKHAYAKPVKTTVEYRYQPAAADGGSQLTRWTYQIKPLRPGADSVLQGWLAPHYRDTSHDLKFVAGADFETPRGLLRCATAPAATGFAIEYPFNGVLSHVAVPARSGLPGDFDADYLHALLKKYDEKEDGVAGDTYFGAKNLVLHARAMHMAKELGMTETYQNIRREIKASLEDWFTYKEGEENHYFARNDRWGSMIGFNFVRDFNLGRFTDIHFHYGYYVLAYAYVAMDDPGFRDRYKEIAIELARAYAEWDRESKRYPWMRTFEPMAGHSYAGGSGSQGGNNQESSSESIQAWAGLFLLGEALRGNDPRADAILAAGAFGYAIETRAVYEYYQDYHGSPFASAPRDYDNQPAQGGKRYPVWPDEFRYGRTVRNYPDKKAWVFTNGIMGDGGNTFATYFGAQPEYIYGIQWLPNAPHMLFLARDRQFTLGQFKALMAYRDEHFASSWMNALDGAPKTLRNEWHKKPTEKFPDLRVLSIDNPWSGTDMKGIVQNLYKLNPAYVKDISHEGDPLRDNPLHDEKTRKWLVEFPADRPEEVVFPKEIWNPDTIVTSYSHLVPPKTEAELADYQLARWATTAFLPPVGPGVDWKQLAAKLSWDPADYPDTPEGRQQSVAQLTTALESIGGSWPLICLTFAGFGDPELGIAVMEESRRRKNQFAEHTETGLFAYYYFHSLRGLGNPVTDQHVSIPSSLVFRDAKTGRCSYMVHNKSDRYELADVFEHGRKIGQVLAQPGKVTTQRGVFAPSSGFSAIGTIPMDGTDGVPLTEERMVIVFSEPFDPKTIAGVKIEGSGSLSLVPMPGGNPQICTFRVQGNWVPGATYAVQVPATVASASGTPGKAVSFSFTVTKGDGCRVAATAPANGATTVSPSLKAIEVEFNSRIDPASLKGLALTGAGSPAVELDGDASRPGRAVFLLKGALRPGASYVFTVPGSVTDVFGQALGQAVEIRFTTDQPDSVMAGFDSEINIAKFRKVASSDDKSQPFENGLRWDFNAVGDFVELAVEAAEAGTYQLKGTCREYLYRGDFRVSVNGKALPKQWNQFDQNGSTTDLGDVRLVAGLNTFRFEVAAVNPASPEKPWLFIQTMSFHRVAP